MSKHSINWIAFLNGIAAADAQAARKAMEDMAIELPRTSANPDRIKIMRSIQYHQQCVNSLSAKPNLDRYDKENLNYHVTMAEYKASLL